MAKKDKPVTIYTDKPLPWFFLLGLAGFEAIGADSPYSPDYELKPEDSDAKLPVN